MLALLFALWTLCTPRAEAFCGFYVSGADTSLYNDATMVVMMRSGTKTVLSMQNSYQGPPEAFAMVVPVPQVLQEENVKTLPGEIFRRVDALASPRLVAYWEGDPCQPPVRPMMRMKNSMVVTEGKHEMGTGVTVEAEFAVGEYDIVILSATDSSGLDRWLRREKYNIPEGADEVLKPYVAAGTKFFVAKVDPERVTFEDGRAVLSPLRMHYDSETFELPVRLGLLNAKGAQDLIVHILAPGQRYEVANYDNAFIPTNLRVSSEVQGSFGAFYEALFTEVARPRTVVTEYSWDASWCDPCPQPALKRDELLTLGGDIIEGQGSMVLTRLHYRYEADGLDADLVFRAAEPVRGGQGTPNPEGQLPDPGAHPAPTNTFQGRYAILHPRTGEVACDKPQRGIWGGPPSGDAPVATARSAVATGRITATPQLANLLKDPIPSVAPKAKPDTPTIPEVGGTPEPAAGSAPEPEGRRCSTTGAAGASALPLILLAAALRRRRRR